MPPVFETPCERCVVGQAGKHGGLDYFILHAEELAAAAIEARAQALDIFGRKLASRMQPELVEHPAKIHEAAHAFVRTSNRQRTYTKEGFMLPAPP